MSPFPHALRQPIATGVWLIRLGFGSICGILFLSIAAAVPGLNFLALGYLLDVQGDVGRTGQWWRPMPQATLFARAGTIVLGCAAWLIPVWYAADAARDSALVAPGSATSQWQFATLLAVSLLVTVHLVGALARGGSFSCFLRPIRNMRWLVAEFRRGGFWDRAQVEMSGLLRELRLIERLWIGIRGFCGTLAWLVVPSLLLAALRDPAQTWQQVLTLLGGLCLVPVLAWLPYLQVRCSVENRWRGIFEVAAVRKLVRHAPVAWLLATTLLYASAVPLFFWSLWMKMRLQPHHAILDLTVISVVCTYPGRILVGWAYHRAGHRPCAWSGWTWFARFLLLALLGSFVYLLFLSSITAEFGRHWLNEHHALLLPIPWW
jgi:hypothetical protein